MTRLEARFADLQRRRRKALMPYLTAGDPHLDGTYELALSCVGAGADLLELGIPFSDPLADGPTIQAAAQRSLAAGTTLAGVLALVERLRRATAVPIVLLVYYNAVCRRGEEAFVESCAAAGVDGLVVPDLPVEENAALAATARAHSLDLIQLIAPTSTPGRRRQTCAQATGFIYCVSVAGVTGARESLPAGLEEFLAAVHAETELPLVVGFGVSTPEQAVRAGACADGVIVGSALVRTAEEAYRSAGLAGASRAVADFLRPFRIALDEAAWEAVP